MKRVLSSLVALFFLSSVFSQIELPTDKVKVTFSVEQDGCEAYIVASVKVVDHWHINASKLPEGSFGLPTNFNLKAGNGYKLSGGIIEPKPINKYDELADEQLSYHEGTFKMKRKIVVTSATDFEISGTFNYQTCNDVKCLPDYTEKFLLKVKGCKTETVEVVKEQDFVENKSGIAKNKAGVYFVEIDKKWHEVPAGNSPEFYKKYLTLTNAEQ